MNDRGDDDAVTTGDRHLPLNLGHRGASGLAPENTRSAFRLAREHGADGVEFDVQLSRDGELVVMHDATLDRTTDGHGQVEQTDWRELRRLDAGRWFDARFAGEPVLTLQDVFDLLGGSFVLNLEMKATMELPDLPERVVACIQRNRPGERLIISSFNWSLLERVRALDPALRIGVLYERDVDAAGYAHLHPDAIHPNRQLVTPVLVSTAHANKQAVNTWTVNDEMEMRRLIPLGVDAIITNYPERLRAVLDDSRLRLHFDGHV